jgi:hypothetical protein
MDRQSQRDHRSPSTRIETNEPRDQGAGPWQHTTIRTDSACEAIGTPTMNRKRTAPLWPSGRTTNNNWNYKNRQCQCDHRYKLQEWQCYCSHHRKRKQSGQCHGGHPYHQQQQEIRLLVQGNNNRQCQRDHRYNTNNNPEEIRGYWSTGARDHTGSKQDMDSAIVALQYGQQGEPTVLLKPSV